MSLLPYHYNYFYYDDCCSQDSKGRDRERAEQTKALAAESQNWNLIPGIHTEEERAFYTLTFTYTP